MIKKGSTVLVEQCWEDEAGAYHDEFAKVISLNPFKIRFFGVKGDVKKFLKTQEEEYNIDQVVEVENIQRK